MRPTLNTHGTRRDSTAIGEKPDQFLVGGAVNGRSSDANFHGIAMDADAFGASRLGLDMHRDRHAAFAVLRDCQTGIHDRERGTG